MLAVGTGRGSRVSIATPPAGGNGRVSVAGNGRMSMAGGGRMSMAGGGRMSIAGGSRVSTCRVSVVRGDGGARASFVDRGGIAREMQAAARRSYYAGQLPPLARKQLEEAEDDEEDNEGEKELGAISSHVLDSSRVRHQPAAQHCSTSSDAPPLPVVEDKPVRPFKRSHTASLPEREGRTFQSSLRSTSPIPGPERSTVGASPVARSERLTIGQPEMVGVSIARRLARNLAEAQGDATFLESSSFVWPVKLRDAYEQRSSRTAAGLPKHCLLAAKNISSYRTDACTEGGTEGGGGSLNSGEACSSHTTQRTSAHASRRSHHSTGWLSVDATVAAVRFATALVGGGGDTATAASAPTRAISRDEVSGRKLMQVRKQFLLLVKSSYNNMLEDSVMPPRSTLALDLMSSVDLAEERIKTPLYDWLVISRLMRVPWHTRILVQSAAFIVSCFGPHTPATKCPGCPAATTPKSRTSPSPPAGVAKKETRRDAQPKGSIGHRLRRLATQAAQNMGNRLLKAYGVHTVYLLTCFITAHEEAQEEVAWVFGDGEHARFHKQVLQVTGESKVAVRRARAYLRDLSKIVVDGQQVSAVIDGVRARQLASLLIHKVSVFAEQMHHHGILDSRSLHHVIEELEHDQLSLEKRVERQQRKQKQIEAVNAAGQQGQGGGTLGPVGGDLVGPQSMVDVCAEMQAVQQNHMQSLRRRLQLEPDNGNGARSLDLKRAPTEKSVIKATIKAGATATSGNKPRARFKAARAAPAIVASGASQGRGWGLVRSQNAMSGSKLHQLIDNHKHESRKAEAAAQVVPQGTRKRSLLACGPADGAGGGERLRERKPSIAAVAAAAIAAQKSAAATSTATTSLKQGLQNMSRVKHRPGEGADDVNMLDLEFEQRDTLNGDMCRDPVGPTASSGSPSTGSPLPVKCESVPADGMRKDSLLAERSPSRKDARDRKNSVPGLPNNTLAAKTRKMSVGATDLAALSQMTPDRKHSTCAVRQPGASNLSLCLARCRARDTSRRPPFVPRCRVLRPLAPLHSAASQGSQASGVGSANWSAPHITGHRRLAFSPRRVKTSHRNRVVTNETCPTRRRRSRGRWETRSRAGPQVGSHLYQAAARRTCSLPAAPPLRNALALQSAACDLV